MSDLLQQINGLTESLVGVADGGIVGQPSAEEWNELKLTLAYLAIVTTGIMLRCETVTGDKTVHVASFAMATSRMCVGLGITDQSTAKAYPDKALHLVINDLREVLVLISHHEEHRQTAANLSLQALVMLADFIKCANVKGQSAEISGALYLIFNACEVLDRIANQPRRHETGRDRRPHHNSNRRGRRQ